MRKGDKDVVIFEVMAEARDQARIAERAATQEVAPAGSGSGTVTSVAMTVPSIFSVAGSPITVSGTLAVTLATQSANRLWAGPTSGGAAAPTFRAMVTADIVDTIVTYAKIQNVTTARLLGRTTAGSGVVEEISVGSGLTLAAGVLDVTGGGSITGSGTNTYVPQWTGASSIGDSLFFLAGGDILTIAQAGGIMSAPAAANARMEIAADAAVGYGSTAILLAVDRDAGTLIVHRAGFSSDSLTEKTLVYGHLTWNTDATYDIGASGANRARDAYLSRSLYAASIKLLGSGSGTATITPPAAAGTPTLTLPTTSGTLALLSDVTGTVSSVALSLPAIFSVSGSPVTTAGTLTGTLANQSANQVWAGPTSGGAAAPTFRAMVAADMPLPAVSAKTANYTTLSTDGTILVSASTADITIDLLNPTAYSGKIVYYKRIDTSAYYVRLVARVGTVETSHAVNLAPNANYSAVGLQSDGSQWWIISAVGGYTLMPASGALWALNWHGQGSGFAGAGINRQRGFGRGKQYLFGQSFGGR